MKIVLDAQKIRMRTETFAYIREQLALPEYFGNNLDALYDCLTEMNETQIVFENTNLAGEFFVKIFRVFSDAAKENENLSILLTESKA